MNMNATASDLGRQLYHSVWLLVSQTFFDTARLANWDSFEHRFDNEIVDEDSAMRCIDEMLASLKDDFTWAERVRTATPTETTATAVSDASAKTEQPDPVMAVLRPDGIGYIRILRLDRGDILDVIEAGVRKIADCEGVVLDLRSNVGGDVQLTAAACGFFLKEGLVTTMDARTDGVVQRTQYALSEDEFFANEHVPDLPPTCKRFLRAAPLLAGKPIVILINKHTMSAAELMTCAIVQNGSPGQVLMVGNGPTPGKGIGQTNFLYLNGTYRVRVTRVRWTAPGGEWLGDCGQTERNPIEPDVLVPKDHGLEGIQVAFKELRKMLDAAKEDLNS